MANCIWMYFVTGYSRDDIQGGGPVAADVWSTLGQRPRRWPNVDQASGQSVTTDLQDVA